MSNTAQRLGKNLGGYAGERIDIKQVLAECSIAAGKGGWKQETISEAPGPELVAFTQASTSFDGMAARIYISAGIHGDEPAGPLAALRLLQEEQWPRNVDLTIIPCLNPSGFVSNRRENSEGKDLNRQYLHPTAAETLAHIAWLDRRYFDVCLCLHEDWESNGFYVYELNPDAQPAVAEKIIAAVAQVCPLDHSEIIEGRQAEGSIIRPNADPRTRDQWPEAYYLYHHHHTNLNCTLEAPSDYPMAVRVDALIAGVKAVVEAKSSVS